MDEDERRRIYEEGKKDSRNAWIAGIAFFVIVPILLKFCAVA